MELILAFLAGYSYIENDLYSFDLYAICLNQLNGVVFWFWLWLLPIEAFYENVFFIFLHSFDTTRDQFGNNNNNRNSDDNYSTI